MPIFILSVYVTTRKRVTVLYTFASKAEADGGRAGKHCHCTNHVSMHFKKSVCFVFIQGAKAMQLVAPRSSFCYLPTQKFTQWMFNVVFAALVYGSLVTPWMQGYGILRLIRNPKQF